MKRSTKTLVLSLALVNLLTLDPGDATAGGDGPRAYALVPADTNVTRFMFLSLDGNQSFEPGTVVQGSELDVNLAALMYVRSFDLNGNSFAPFMVLSYGEIDGALELGGTPPTALTGDQSGLFDLQLGLVYGFLGSPALNSPAEYAAHTPGLQMGVLTKAFLPVGSYDSGRVLNTGGNRYALQLGLPTTLAMGTSFLDPDFSSIEVLPSVTFFGDNDDPTGGAVQSGQDPLFAVEAHFTRNFGRSLWASLDALYEYGGETKTDGVGNDDRQEAFSLGASVNYTLPSGVNLQASYGEVIWSNRNGRDGSQFRFAVISTF
jgi:hypothetical protein